MCILARQLFPAHLQATQQRPLVNRWGYVDMWLARRARDSCIRSAPNVKCIYYGNMVDRPRAVQRCFNLSHATCPRSTRIYIYISV